MVGAIHLSVRTKNASMESIDFSEFLKFCVHD